LNNCTLKRNLCLNGVICVDCGVGREPNWSLDGGVECDFGFYKDRRFGGICVGCAAGLIALNSGATSVDSCGNRRSKSRNCLAWWVFVIVGVVVLIIILILFVIYKKKGKE
jgi:hypothetical protein